MTQRPTITDLMDTAAGTGQPSSGLPRKRNRAAQACGGCRKRKVRCDMTKRVPCANCVAWNQDCELDPPPIGTARQSSKPSNLHLSPRTLRRTEVSYQRQLERQTGVSQHVPRGHEVQLSLLDADTQSYEQTEDARFGDPPLNLQETGTQGGEVSSTSTLAGTSICPKITADDEIWSRNLQEMSNVSPKHASTTSLGTSPTMSSSIQHPQTHPRKRLRFSGETLAHSILPVMNGHAELSALSGNQATPQVDLVGLRSVSAPTSQRPQGIAPWVNADCQLHLNLVGHLPAEDRHYLYNMKRVFSFPPKSVGSELIRVFFESVYPLFPIFDRREILERCEKLYTRQESSPLLFHALLFSACQFASEKLLQDAGFTDVAEARIYFFQRAKVLYSYDCEPDHIVVVQSLILLSFWWMDYTEEKDMRYWLTCAVNLALTMGMHKTLPKSLNMSEGRRKLWRRIFWILYSREHQVATALGQPFLLHLKDCDLEMLSKADFEEDWQDREELVRKTDLGFRILKQTPCHTMVALKHIELAVLMEKLLLSLQDARSHCEALEKLHDFREIASPELLYSSTDSLDGFSIDNTSSWTRENVFVVFLHLYHERIAIFYHRRLERALFGVKRMGERTGIPTEADNARSSNLSCTDLGIDLAATRADIVSSAERVFSLLASLSSEGLLRFAPSNVVTTIFHSFLALAEEIISNPQGSTRHDKARETFHVGLKAVEELRKHWSAASWCYVMYSKLAENDFSTLKPNAGQSVYRPLLQSRLPSGSATPLMTNEAAAMWDIDFLDSTLTFDDAAPFAFDPFSDWPNIGSGDVFSRLQQ